MRTPGVCCSITHGSRAVGIDFNSSLLNVVPGDCLRVSSSGDSEVTVIVVATDAIFIEIESSVFVPRLTITLLRSTVAKPESSVLTEYVHGARLDEAKIALRLRRRRPRCSAAREGDRDAGELAPCSSLTVPQMLPDVACANSEALNPVAIAKMAKFRMNFILSPSLSLVLRAKNLFPLLFLSDTDDFSPF